MELRNIFVDKYEVGQKELYEFLSYCFLIFLFPIVLGHLTGLPNQFLVGTLVNSILVLSAFYRKVGRETTLF